MDLFNYYGLDWLGMALSILAMYMLGNKQKWGFIVFVIANALWMWIGIYLMDSWGIVIGNLVFLVANARGYMRWKATSAT